MHLLKINNEDRHVEILDGDITPQIYNLLTLDKTAVQVDVELNRDLNYLTGKLCLIQLQKTNGISSDKITYLVKYNIEEPCDSPYLAKLFEHSTVPKLFHYGKVDLCFIAHNLNCKPRNILCTKVASKILRGQGDDVKHNLDVLCKEFLGIQLDKGEQLSDWAQKELTPSQIKYAALDVEYLSDLFKLLATHNLDLYEVIMDNCKFYETLIDNIINQRNPLNNFPQGLWNVNQEHGINTTTLFEYQ